MELGGKSPAVVFADADLEAAIDSTIFGVFSLNGERCTAGSRILVERSVYDEFVERYAARATRIVVGDPHDPATEVGALVHPEHYAKVMRYIEIGKTEGRLVAGGGRPEGLETGNYVAPTVFADVAARRADLPGGDLRPGRRHHRRSTPTTRHSRWPTASGTASPPTSGPPTSSARTRSRRPSRPAWSG